MYIKYILFFTLFFVTVASAGTDIVGTGGNEWNGNVTLENVSKYADDVVGLYGTEMSNGSDSGSWVVQYYNLQNSYSVSDDGERLNFTINVSASDGVVGYERILDSNISTDVYTYMLIREYGTNIMNQFQIMVFYDDATDATLTLNGNTYGNSTSEYDYYESSTFKASVNITRFRIYLYPRLTNVDYHYYIDWVLAGGVNTSGNVTRNYTSVLGAGEEVQTFQFNGSTNDSTKKYTIRTSTDDITYNVFQYNAAPYPITYDVSGNGYKYVKVECNTTDDAQTPEIYNITGIYGTTGGTFDLNVTYWNPSSGGLVATYNITNITAGVNSINILLNVTRDNWKYTMTYSNGTEVENHVATFTNESLNFSVPLVEDSYNITESPTVSTSTIIILGNSWGMINNWTVATNFTNIATNEVNDICYSYYNVTTSEWDSHYVGYSWNANYEIPLEASVMVFVNAQTTVTATIVTPANTSLYTGWNMLFIEGTDNETIADIIIDMEASL